jgi:hypothetical protein
VLEAWKLRDGAFSKGLAFVFLFPLVSLPPTVIWLLTGETRGQMNNDAIDEHDAAVGVNVAPEPAGPFCWIFQYNPMRFNLEAFFQRHPAGEMTWKVPNPTGIWNQGQNRGRRIEAGDVVFIYRCGDNGSIVAYGEIISNIAVRIQEPQDANVFPRGFGDPAERVRICIRPLRNAITMDTLRNDDVLRGLSRVTNNMGTNFGVTPNQRRRLESFLPGIRVFFRDLRPKVFRDPFLSTVEQVDAAWFNAELENNVLEIRPNDRFYAVLDDVLPRTLQEVIVTQLFAGTPRPIILSGPPGVGKSYIMQYFVRLLVPWSRESMFVDDYVRVVQFFPSYTYEDFIEGLRPVGARFAHRPGVFLSFCRSFGTDHPYPAVFCIEELSRANVVDVFGEVFQLLDGRHMDERTVTLRSGSVFALPRNVIIMCTMNLEDRSVGVFDRALLDRMMLFTVSGVYSPTTPFQHAGVQPYPSHHALWRVLGRFPSLRDADIVRVLWAANRRLADLGYEQSIGFARFANEAQHFGAAGLQGFNQWCQNRWNYSILPQLFGLVLYDHPQARQQFEWGDLLALPTQ